MTSAEYRKKAEKLLTGWAPTNMPDGVVEQAAVWASLANAAAIEEQGQAALEAQDQAVRCGE